MHDTSLSNGQWVWCKGHYHAVCTSQISSKNSKHMLIPIFSIYCTNSKWWISSCENALVDCISFIVQWTWHKPWFEWLYVKEICIFLIKIMFLLLGLTRRELPAWKKLKIAYSKLSYVALKFKDYDLCNLHCCSINPSRIIFSWCAENINHLWYLLLNHFISFCYSFYLVKTSQIFHKHNWILLRSSMRQIHICT